jgi:hypothetical protein
VENVKEKERNVNYRVKKYVYQSEIIRIYLESQKVRGKIRGKSA